MWVEKKTNLVFLVFKNLSYLGDENSSTTLCVRHSLLAPNHLKHLKYTWKHLEYTWNKAACGEIPLGLWEKVANKMKESECGVAMARE